MWFDPTHVKLVQEGLPSWTAFIFAAISYLGSVYVVVPVLVGAYLLVDRHRFAPWFAIGLSTYAVMVALKGVFSVPRPGVGPALDPVTLPTAVAVVYAPAVEIGTTSFPSGHALATVVLWGLFALESDVGTRRSRLVVAALLVGLVSFSRVAVGVHYPVDVVAGVALGVVLLSVLLSLEAWLPERVDVTSVLFLVGVVVSLLALVVGNRQNAAILLGCSIGSLVSWQFVRPRADLGVPTVRSARTNILLASAAVAGGLLLTTDAPLGWFGAGGLAGAVVIALPRLTGSLSSGDHQVCVD